MFEVCGYSVQKIEGINPHLSWKWKVFNIISFGFFSNTKYLQFVCVTKPIQNLKD